jgi:hypothetical protein
VVSSAAYTLFGPNAFTRSGTLDFAGSQQVGFLVVGVPAATGYTLDVSLTTPDDSDVCSGTASFDVVAMQTTSATLPVTCTAVSDASRATGVGSLRVWVPIPAGISLTSLDCVLLGPNGLHEDNILSIAGQSTVSFALDNVPAGTASTLTVSGTPANGSACSATSPLDVIAQQTSDVTLVLQCPNVPADGDP